MFYHSCLDKGKYKHNQVQNFTGRKMRKLKLVSFSLDIFQKQIYNNSFCCKLSEKNDFAHMLMPLKPVSAELSGKSNWLEIWRSWVVPVDINRKWFLYTGYHWHQVTDYMFKFFCDTIKTSYFPPACPSGNKNGKSCAQVLSYGATQVDSYHMVPHSWTLTIWCHTFRLLP